MNCDSRWRSKLEPVEWNDMWWKNWFIEIEQVAYNGNVLLFFIRIEWIDFGKYTDEIRANQWEGKVVLFDWIYGLI